MTMIITSDISFTGAFSVLPFIKSLDQFYPEIEHWYINKVIPGIMLGDDKLVIARKNNQIAGISLGKVDGSETKLRCIRVHPDFQQSGLGIKLIDKMLDLIEDDKPGVTVSEEMFHLYSRMFMKRYGFKLSDVTKGQYRPRKLEYLYNNVR